MNSKNWVAWMIEWGSGSPRSASPGQPSPGVATGGQALGPTTDNATKAASIQAGTVVRRSGPASGLQGRVVVMATMATDDSSKARPVAW